jgi:hypothetical protein
MSTNNSASGVCSSKTTSRKARKQMNKMRDRTTPQVAVVVAKTKRVSRKIVEHVPADTKQGFADGRQAGNDLISDLPYLAGAAVGFVYGAGEAVVGALATPVSNVFAWARSLAYGE